jgi:hypothetical protein
MKLRKLLYLPSIQHKMALVADLELIMEKCNEVAQQEFKEHKENQKAHDNRCPKCRAMQDKIVDKIRSVEGSGKVGGDFYLGFGSVKGSVSINTEAVNYCKSCDHEWKKFKVKYFSKTDILRVAMNYLAEIMSDPEGTKRQSWKHEAVEVFGGRYAESIRFLRDKHERYLRSKTQDTLKIKTLRKSYLSVFDDELD